MSFTYTSALIVVKAGNPSKVQVLDMSKNAVTLAWSRPTSDGGDAIQGYVIEYRKIGEHWAPFNKKPIDDLKAKGLFNDAFFNLYCTLYYAIHYALHYEIHYAIYYTIYYALYCTF